MKKILSVSFATALALSLSGCIGEDSVTSVSTGSCVYEYSYYDSVLIFNDYPIEACQSLSSSGYDTYYTNKSCSDFSQSDCTVYDYDTYGGVY